MTDSESGENGEVEVHFIKSNAFRVVHVDGAWGGITHRGNVHMALYNERPPIPKVVKVDSATGKESSRLTRAGIVREVEVEAVLDLGTAVSLRDWLNDHIRTLVTQLEERGARLPKELLKEIES